MGGGGLLGIGNPLIDLTLSIGVGGSVGVEASTVMAVGAERLLSLTRCQTPLMSFKLEIELLTLIMSRGAILLLLLLSLSLFLFSYHPVPSPLPEVQAPQLICDPFSEPGFLVPSPYPFLSS